MRLAEGLVEIARGLFAQMATGPKYLVGHWSVTGASTPTGLPTDLFREPVLDLAALDTIGFDAIVLGHIHKPQMIPTPSGRPIFYVGSPTRAELRRGRVEPLRVDADGRRRVPDRDRVAALLTIEAEAFESDDGIGRPRSPIRSRWDRREDRQGADPGDRGRRRRRLDVPAVTHGS